MCGSFEISGSELEVRFKQEDGLTAIQRAALSHQIRVNQDAGHPRPFISTDWLDRFLEGARLSSPAKQATNIIRLVGDKVANKGKPMGRLPPFLWAAVGSPNPEFAYSIVKELYDDGLISGITQEAMGTSGNMLNASLTLRGWDRYEAEKHGQLSANYGFVALKFNDPELDPFLKDVIKPAVAELGYALIDMRDAAQPGVIDNILREKIRDAAFVLVDLTHDNSGAYWEAGYAEGLGKPVLYLCEQKKFDERKTHFDTNHCTTVTWGGEKTNDDFCAELRATLRNSLRLFPR